MPARQKKILYSKKYLYSVLLWIASTLFLVILVSSIVFYYNAESIVVKNYNKYNQEVLLQAKYNIDMLNENMKNVCRYLFFNADVNTFMYDRDLENNLVDKYLSLEKINSSVVSINQSIRSVYFYNNYINKYIATSDSFYIEDEELAKTIDAYHIVPRLQPVMRKIKSYGTGKKVSVKTVVPRSKHKFLR